MAHDSMPAVALQIDCGIVRRLREQQRFGIDVVHGVSNKTAHFVVDVDIAEPARHVRDVNAPTVERIRWF